MAFPLLAVGAAFLGVVIGVVLSGVKQPKPQAQAFQRPKAEEGAPIVVVFGTVDLRSPNTVDFGDTKVEPNLVSGGGKK